MSSKRRPRPAPAPAPPPALKVTIPSRKLQKHPLLPLALEEHESVNVNVENPRKSNSKLGTVNKNGVGIKKAKIEPPLPKSSSSSSSSSKDDSSLSALELSNGSVSRHRQSSSSSSFSSQSQSQEGGDEEEPPGDRGGTAHENETVDPLDQIQRKIEPILEKSQAPNANQVVLAKELEAVYRASSKTEFAKALIRIMAVPFKRKDINTNPNVKVMISFFQYAVNNMTYTEGEGETQGPTYLQHLVLRLCMRHRRDAEPHCREKVYDTINRILADIGRDYISTMNKNFSSKVQEAYLEGLKDRYSRVRLLCAYGLQLFVPKKYEPGIKILTELTFHMLKDPIHEVRKLALLSMCFGEENHHLLKEKVMDVDENVRKTAFEFISRKNLLDQVRLELREDIVEAGLKDKSENVRKAACEALQSFYKGICGGDLIMLMNRFDPFTKKSLCCLILDTLIPRESDFEKLNLSFLENSVIPPEKLGSENVMIWLFIVRKFPARVKIPEPLVMLDYILNCAKYLDKTDPEQLLSHTLNALLQVFMSSLLEEGIRRKIPDWIKKLIECKSITESNINYLIRLLHHSKPQNLNDEIVKLVQHCLDTNTVPKTDPKPQPAPVKTVLKTPKRKKTIRKSIPRTKKLEAQIHELGLEKSQLVFSWHKTYRSLDTARANKDFLLAQKLHEKMDSLKQSQRVIEEKIDSLEKRVVESKNEDAYSDVEIETHGYSSESDDEEDTNTNAADTTPSSQADDIGRGPPGHTPEKGLAAEPIYTVRGLTLAFACLAYHLKLTPGKRAPYAGIFIAKHRNQAFAGPESTEFLREYALQAQTSYALVEPDTAVVAMGFLLNAVHFDTRRIQNLAYKSMFALTSKYGFDKFDVEPIKTAMAPLKNKLDSMHKMFNETMEMNV